MLDSQVKITERLNSLNLDEEVKQFFMYVMDFYKGHIKKLQSMIVEKQKEIDEANQVKQNYEERINDMQNEIERYQYDLKEQAENNDKRTYNDLEMTIQSLRDDLNNRAFDQNVYEETIRNFRAQIESLKTQNNIFMSQTNSAKTEVAELRMKLQRYEKTSANAFQDDLRREVANLKNELAVVKNFNVDTANKSSNNFYQKPVQEFSQEVVKETPKRFYNRTEERNENRISVEKPRMEQRTEQRIEPKIEVVNKMAYNEDRPLDIKKGGGAPPVEEKKTNTKANTGGDKRSPQELESYLKYLLEKEHECQTKVWKLPAKAKTKVEKIDKKEAQGNLDEVLKEIDLVRDLLKK